MDKETLFSEIAKLLDKYECDSDGHLIHTVACSIIFMDESNDVFDYDGTDFVQLDED